MELIDVGYKMPKETKEIADGILLFAKLKLEGKSWTEIGLALAAQAPGMLDGSLEVDDEFKAMYPEISSYLVCGVLGLVKAKMEAPVESPVEAAPQA